MIKYGVPITARTLPSHPLALIASKLHSFGNLTIFDQQFCQQIRSSIKSATNSIANKCIQTEGKDENEKVSCRQDKRYSTIATFSPPPLCLLTIEFWDPSFYERLHMLPSQQCEEKCHIVFALESRLARFVTWRYRYTTLHCPFPPDAKFPTTVPCLAIVKVARKMKHPPLLSTSSVVAASVVTTITLSFLICILQIMSRFSFVFIFLVAMFGIGKSFFVCHKIDNIL